MIIVPFEEIVFKFIKCLKHFKKKIFNLYIHHTHTHTHTYKPELFYEHILCKKINAPSYLKKENKEKMLKSLIKEKPRKCFIFQIVPVFILRKIHQFCCHFYNFLPQVFLWYDVGLLE